jgi:phytoene dehydrogenase-like protein
MHDVVVIGGGANGLVAAARLGQAGLRVLLIEAGETLGGQGRVVTIAPGFTAAPLGVDPGWLPPHIARALALDGLEPDAADPGLSVMVAPGSFLTLSRDARRAAQAIAAHSKSDAERWPAFTERLRALAGFLEEVYALPAPDVNASSLGEALPLLGLGRKFRALGRRNMIEFLRTLPLSVAEILDDTFECAPLKAAVATLGIRDHQQGPRSGGTGFVLLHHLVGAPSGSMSGRLPWRAGPDAFTQSAERAVRRFGVEIRTGTSAVRIEAKDYAVAGLTLADGSVIECRTVLSTADPASTFLGGMDPVWLDPEFLHAVQNVRHRGCTAVVMVALDALPRFPGLESEQALAGTLSLTPSTTALERAADAAKYGTVSETPHVELTIPTLRWPSSAPPGRHVLVARVQYAPYRLRDRGTWDAARSNALAEKVIAAIEAASPGFRSRILERVVWSPADLEDKLGLREGAPSQGELGLDQILFMRPVAGWSRYATPIAGLYLGGAGTHPGPGVLGGAGWLAAQQLLRDRKRG